MLKFTLQSIKAYSTSRASLTLSLRYHGVILFLMTSIQSVIVIGYKEWLSSKGGSIGSTLAWGPRDLSSNPAQIFLRLSHIVAYFHNVTRGRGRGRGTHLTGPLPGQSNHPLPSPPAPTPPLPSPTPTNYLGHFPEHLNSARLNL